MGHCPKDGICGWLSHPMYPKQVIIFNKVVGKVILSWSLRLTIQSLCTNYSEMLKLATILLMKLTCLLVNFNLHN